MLNWILMYELGAAISWAILLWLTWYASVKVAGMTNKQFWERFHKLDTIELLKWVAYMVLWPIEFTFCAIEFIQSIKVMKELNKCDEEQA